MPTTLACLLLAVHSLMFQPAVERGTSRESQPESIIIERRTLPAAEGSKAVVERVIYRSDGLKIQGYLAYPRDAVSPAASPPAATPGKKLPCILYNRGGNRETGAVTEEVAQALGRLAGEWGYVLFASNYRGYKESEGVDQFGGDDLNDILNALPIFEELPFADAERIGMWGRSRGGMMTYLALKKTSRIDAAVVAAGLADLERCTKARADIEQVCTELIPNWTKDRAAAIESRSAVRWADKLPANVPILIVHGTADWRVDPRDALDMAAKLQEFKRPYRLLMLEGTDHAQTEFKETYEHAVRDWFDRYVRDGAPLPNLTPHGS